MKEFNKVTLATVRREINALLKKHSMDGVDLELTSCSYGETQATYKLVAKIQGAETREEKALSMYAKFDGIDPNQSGPKGEKLVEYHTRKRKYPYIYIIGGKRFKCDAATAKRMFGK